MKRTLVLLVALAGVASTASADVQRNFADAPVNPLATPWTRVAQPTYVIQDPAIPRLEGDAVHASPLFSNIIYLNKCTGGCQVQPGNNDSTATPIRSTIPDVASTVAQFAYSDTVWQDVVKCVKATYAPFGVVVTDVRPPAGTNYHMAIVAGLPQNVQMQQGVGGVSPFTCGYIPNAVSFSFANVYGPDVDEICWTVAQETAHSWGLDHKFDVKDPMTYLSGAPTRKLFQNAAGSCGEYQARACQCGGNSMNSFQEIVDTFGSSTPTPPMVSFNEPADGAFVNPMFTVKAKVMDDVAATKAELRIDGALVATSSKETAGVFTFMAPATVGQGKHKVEVTGYDVAFTPAKAEISVTIGMACTKPADCADNTQTCVDGRCVPGSGVQGGLGSACAANTDCASGQCANDGAGESHCVETCSIAADACPSGFDCIDAGMGDNGVCWPGSGGGGCDAGGGGGTLMLGLGLGLAAITRRRRR